MFAPRFFPSHYFAPTYWPVGAAATPTAEGRPIYLRGSVERTIYSDGSVERTITIKGSVQRDIPLRGSM